MIRKTVWGSTMLLLHSGRRIKQRSLRRARLYKSAAAGRAAAAPENRPRADCRKTGRGLGAGGRTHSRGRKARRRETGHARAGPGARRTADRPDTGCAGTGYRRAAGRIRERCERRAGTCAGRSGGGASAVPAALRGGSAAARAGQIHALLRAGRRFGAAAGVCQRRGRPARPGRAAEN